MRQTLHPGAARSIAFVLLALFMLVAGAGAAQAQGAPQGLTATVAGNNVTLQWQAPSTPGYTGYLIEAGTSPSPAPPVAAIPVGNVLSFGVVAPNGQYYVRVRALYGSTPGAASNEVSVLVTLPPPTAPANFTASITRFTVAFNWTAGAGSAAVTGWQLHAGSAPGLSDLAVVPLPSDTLRLVATAPAGTYYVRVYAVNEAGVSPPSAELRVVNGPNVCDIPLMPTGFSAVAGTGNVQLAWNPWSGILPGGYLLAVRTDTSNLGTFPIPRASTFSSAAPPGTYYARLAAFNGCGASPFSSEISFTVR